MDDVDENKNGKIVIGKRLAVTQYFCGSSFFYSLVVLIRKTYLYRDFIESVWVDFSLVAVIDFILIW